MSKIFTIHVLYVIFSMLGVIIKMNENIDVRMSNFLKIVSDPEIRKQFDWQTVMQMEKALVIYASTTAEKYVQDYESQKATNNQMKSAFEQNDGEKSKGRLLD